MTTKIDTTKEQKTEIFNPNERFEKNEYFQSKKIIVKMSHPEMGLGVFATEDIEAGELIERCPMIQLDFRAKYHNDVQIHKYCYSNKGCECKECQVHGSSLFMVLGYGMIYNHQDEPNTDWNFSFLNLIADVIAAKPIKAGEEIFVTYGPNYFNNREKFVVNSTNQSEILIDESNYIDSIDL